MQVRLRVMQWMKKKSSTSNHKIAFHSHISSKQIYIFAASRWFVISPAIIHLIAWRYLLYGVISRFSFRCLLHISRVPLCIWHIILSGAEVRFDMGPIERLNLPTNRYVPLIDTNVFWSKEPFLAKSPFPRIVSVISFSPTISMIELGLRNVRRPTWGRHWPGFPST